MFDEFHVGLYGNTSNWAMVMNVNTGNVGLGTTLPTADLDINGSLRLRQSGVANGAVLHAINSQGGAEWINPTAFRVNGYSYGVNIIFPNNTWQDINFGTNVAYNFQTASYNTSNSEFVAPRNGVYHFKSQLHFSNAGYVAQQRLRLRRNGVVSTLAHVQFDHNTEIAFHYFSSLLDTEVLLQAGDEVWIEAYGQAFGSGNVNINGNSTYTWWCGRLVQPL
jgi:hypothetical protein